MKKRPEVSVAELMQQIKAARGFGPVPTDQYFTYQDARYEPHIRLWAWLLAHTIHQGPELPDGRRQRRSPFAVNEDGQALDLRDAARDLGMDLANTRRAWRQIEHEQRASRDEGKLWIRGEVNLPEALSPIGEDKAKEVCTDLFPPYIFKQIKKLPQKQREEITKWFEGCRVVERALAAGSMATIRDVIEQGKDSTYDRFGIKKIRDDPAAPRQKKKLESIDENERRLRADLAAALKPVIERSVQTFSGSVQTRETGLYSEVSADAPLLMTERDRETPSVSGHFPLKSSSSSSLAREKTTTTTMKTASPELKNNTAEMPASDEIQVEEALAKWNEGHAESKQAARLIAACRAIAADASAGQIAHFIDRSGAKMNRRFVKAPVEYLIASVPKCFASRTWKRPFESAAVQPAAAPDLELQTAYAEYREAEITQALQQPETSRRFAELVKAHEKALPREYPSLASVPKQTLREAAEQRARVELAATLPIATFEEYSAMPPRRAAKGGAA